MWLAHFPPEILAQIFTGELYSYLIFRLVLCGDPILTRKLLSHVDYIDLKDNKSQTPIRLPKLLSSFLNLRYLSIEHSYSHEDPQKLHLPAKLEKFPLSKLETLKFSTDAWIPALSAYASRMGPVRLSRYRFVMEKLCMLTTLSLGKAKLPANAQILQCLPATLTCLSGDRMEIRLASEPIFSSLPRNLQILDVELLFMVLPLPAFYESPPPQLHTITSICWMRELPNFAWLPRTLKHCRLDEGPWDPERVRSLPPQLVCDFPIYFTCDPLDFQRQGGNWSAGFPKSFLSLEIGKYTDSGDEDSHILSHLPPSLTELCLSSERSGVPRLSWALDAINHWPTNLTSFTMAEVCITRSTLQLLPQTLTSLKLAYWCSASFDAKLLPQSLATLYLHVDIFDELTFISDWPSTLTRLSLRSKEPELVLHNLRLPEGLVHLDTNCTLAIHTSTEVVSTVNLPSTLKTLNMGRWFISHFGEIPSSVQELYMHGISTKIGFPSDAEASDAFASLPSGLRVLSMPSDVPFQQVWSKDSFSTLTQLKRLDLSKFGQLDPETLQRLLQQGTKVWSQ